MTAQTPGPWTVMGADEVVAKDARRWISRPHLEHEPGDAEFLVDCANARLIAAAPDLYAALDGLGEAVVEADNLDDGKIRDALNAAKAALAKVSP